MIERFNGEGGRVPLVEEICRQTIVNGNGRLAEIIADNVNLLQLEVGEVLIEQNDEDNNVYFILTGEMSIEINSESVATRSAGVHVGEMAMIDRRAVRSASCKATAKSVVAEMTERDFSAIADDNPVLWRRIAAELSVRLYDRNKMVKKPISFGQFLMDELILYVATMVMVFVFAVIKTDTLKNENALTDFVLKQINPDTMSEIVLLILSILAVIGLLQLARQMTGSQRIDGGIQEFLQEIPRAIYFLGASVSGALLAIVFFVYQPEDSNSLAFRYAVLSFVFSAMFFSMGFFISFLLKRKDKKIQPIQWLF